MELPVEAVIELVLGHPGHGFRCIDSDVLTAFIRYEFDSGRWAGLRDSETDQVNGWISWYNFSPDSLAEVKDYGLPGCYRHDIRLHPGRHCYISNVVVREGMPKGAFRLLWNLVCLRNPGAETFNAHLCNRPVKDGEQHWRWFSRRNRDYRQPQEVQP